VQGQVPYRRNSAGEQDAMGQMGADGSALFGSASKDDRWSSGGIDWRIGALS
jgi:hypothetical protein